MAETEIRHDVRPIRLTARRNSQVPTAFRKMSFFLDLREYADSDRLANDIRSLGGTVEAFLTKDVKYVVTNRCRSTKLSEEEQSPRPSSRSLSPSSLSLSSTSSNQESTEQLRNQHQNSRAGLLVERARQVSAAVPNCGRNLRQLAHSWGIKFVHVTTVTDWIQKVLTDHAKRTIQDNVSNENRCVRLSTPFLKYEDVQRCYMPQHRQFTSWPTVRFNDEQRPADSEPSPATRKSPKRDPKTATTRGARRAMCEICSASCTNIYEHVDSLKHRELVANGDLFAELDATIRKLPSPEVFCRLVAASENNCSVFQADPHVSPSPHKRCGLAIVNTSPASKRNRDQNQKQKRKLSSLSDADFGRPPSTPAKVRATTTDVAYLRSPMKELNRIAPTSSPWKCINY